MPIWKPFIDWMAAWALPGLSKLTNPGGKANRERQRERGIRMLLDEEARQGVIIKEWSKDEFITSSCKFKGTDDCKFKTINIDRMTTLKYLSKPNMSNKE